MGFNNPQIKLKFIACSKYNRNERNIEHDWRIKSFDKAFDVNMIIKPTDNWMLETITSCFLENVGTAVPFLLI